MVASLFMARIAAVQDRPGRHAQLCADHINQYWLAKCFNANARVVEKQLRKQNETQDYISTLYEIRSDTLNGMPINKIEGAQK